MLPIALILLFIGTASTVLAEGDAASALAEGADRAAEAAEPAEAGKAKPLSASDEAARKIISNFITAIGARQPPPVRHVRATGRLVYGSETKQVELVETNDFRRCLTMEWRYMGREYRERIVARHHPRTRPDHSTTWREIEKKMLAADGTHTWERVFLEIRRNGRVQYREAFGHTIVSGGRSLGARRLTLEQQNVISGDYAELPSAHFQGVFLLLHPFFSSSGREVGYHYGGAEKLLRRPVYLVEHQSQRHFYFDQEKFLLLRWSGKGALAGQSLYIDYQSTAFKRWEGILFPSKVAILSRGAPLGRYEFDRVEVNGSYDSALFALPEY